MEEHIDYPNSTTGETLEHGSQGKERRISDWCKAISTMREIAACEGSRGTFIESNSNDGYGAGLAACTNPVWPLAVEGETPPHNSKRNEDMSLSCIEIEPDSPSSNLLRETMAQAASATTADSVRSACVGLELFDFAFNERNEESDRVQHTGLLGEEDHRDRIFLLNDIVHASAAGLGHQLSVLKELRAEDARTLEEDGYNPHLSHLWRCRCSSLCSCYKGVGEMTRRERHYALLAEKRGKPKPVLSVDPVVGRTLCSVKFSPEFEMNSELGEVVGVKRDNKTRRSKKSSEEVRVQRVEPERVRIPYGETKRIESVSHRSGKVVRGSSNRRFSQISGSHGEWTGSDDVEQEIPMMLVLAGGPRRDVLNSRGSKRRGGTGVYGPTLEGREAARRFEASEEESSEEEGLVLREEEVLITTRFPPVERVLPRAIGDGRAGFVSWEALSDKLASGAHLVDYDRVKRVGLAHEEKEERGYGEFKDGEVVDGEEIDLDRDAVLQYEAYGSGDSGSEDEISTDSSDRASDHGPIPDGGEADSEDDLSSSDDDTLSAYLSESDSDESIQLPPLIPHVPQPIPQPPPPMPWARFRLLGVPNFHRFFQILRIFSELWKIAKRMGPRWFEIVYGKGRDCFQYFCRKLEEVRRAWAEPVRPRGGPSPSLDLPPAYVNQVPVPGVDMDEANAGHAFQRAMGEANRKRDFKNKDSRLHDVKLSTNLVLAERSRLPREVQGFLSLFDSSPAYRLGGDADVKEREFIFTIPESIVASAAIAPGVLDLSRTAKMVLSSTLAGEPTMLAGFGDPWRWCGFLPRLFPSWFAKDLVFRPSLSDFRVRMTVSFGETLPGLARDARHVGATHMGLRGDVALQRVIITCRLQVRQAPYVDLTVEDTSESLFLRTRNFFVGTGRGFRRKPVSSVGIVGKIFGFVPDGLGDRWDSEEFADLPNNIYSGGLVFPARTVNECLCSATLLDKYQSSAQYPVQGIEQILAVAASTSLNSEINIDHNTMVVPNTASLLLLLGYGQLARSARENEARSSHTAAQIADLQARDMTGRLVRYPLSVSH